MLAAGESGAALTESPAAISAPTCRSHAEELRAGDRLQDDLSDRAAGHAHRTAFRGHHHRERRSAVLFLAAGLLRYAAHRPCPDPRGLPASNAAMAQAPISRWFPVLTNALYLTAQLVGCGHDLSPSTACNPAFARHQLHQCTASAAIAAKLRLPCWSPHPRSEAAMLSDAAPRSRRAHDLRVLRCCAQREEREPAPASIWARR